MSTDNEVVANRAAIARGLLQTRHACGVDVKSRLSQISRDIECAIVELPSDADIVPLVHAWALVMWCAK